MFVVKFVGEGLYVYGIGFYVGNIVGNLNGKLEI